MFSASFAAAFAGRGVAAGAFSSAFAAPFAGLGPAAAGYIAPMMAQAALVAGASWSVVGSGLVVSGRWLIGPAGKVFVFASPDSAALWVENAKGIGAREAVIRATLPGPALASWAVKKREKLAVIAARVVAAAARQGDEAKRAALLAESDYCLSKWG